MKVASDRGLQMKFGASTLTQIWVCVRQEHPELGQKSLEQLLPFACTYLCEASFSAMKSKEWQRSSVRYKSMFLTQRDLSLSQEDYLFEHPHWVTNLFSHCLSYSTFSYRISSMWYQWLLPSLLMIYMSSAEPPSEIDRELLIKVYLQLCASVFVNQCEHLIWFSQRNRCVCGLRPGFRVQVRMKLILRSGLGRGQSPHKVRLHV